LAELSVMACILSRIGNRLYLAIMVGLLWR
jgi:hypothetical protein